MAPCPKHSPQHRINVDCLHCNFDVVFAEANYERTQNKQNKERIAALDAWIKEAAPLLHAAQTGTWSTEDSRRSKALLGHLP